MRRSSMTKRNAHALQRRYTKLLARATALTSAAWHFGQGVTGRPPWSLGFGMLGAHCFPHGMCQLRHNDSRQVAGRSGRFVRPKSWSAIPFVSLGGLHTVPPGGASQSTAVLGRSPKRIAKSIEDVIATYPEQAPRLRRWLEHEDIHCGRWLREDYRE